MIPQLTIFFVDLSIVAFVGGLIWLRGRHQNLRVSFSYPSGLGREHSYFGGPFGGPSPVSRLFDHLGFRTYTVIASKAHGRMGKGKWRYILWPTASCWF
jgi:hypothetical protein